MRISRRSAREIRAGITIGRSLLILTHGNRGRAANHAFTFAPTKLTYRAAMRTIFKTRP